jgi:ABC-type sulfate transport system permease subunit
VAENLLGMVQADMLCEEESFFGKNYSKTIIKLTFAIAMVVDGSSSS